MPKISQLKKQPRSSEPKVKNIETKVNKILKEVSLYLGMHGGDVKLIEVTSQGVAKVQFTGACVGCSAANSTLDYLLKESILSQCPEIIDVEAINLVQPDHTPPGILI